MKHGLEGIDLYNPIKGKMPQIIDYFVEFYGEEYRDRITERLNGTDYIFADRVTMDERNPLEIYFYKLNRDKLLEFQETVARNLRIAINFSPDNIKENFDKIEKWKDGVNERDYLQVTELFLHMATDIRNPRDLKIALENPNMSKRFYGLLNSLYDIYVKGGYKEAFDYYYTEEKHLAKRDDPEFVAISQKLESRFRRQSECLILETLIRTLKIEPTEKNVEKLLGISEYVVDYVEIGKINPQLEKPLLLRLAGELKPMSNLTIQRVAGNLGQTDDLFVVAAKEALDSLVDDINKLRDAEFFGILSARAGLFEPLENIYENYLLGADCIVSIQDFMLSKEMEKGGFNACIVDLEHPEKTKSVCVNHSYLTLDEGSLIHEMNHAIVSTAALRGNLFYQKTGLRNQVVELFEDDARILYENFHDYTAIDEIINEYFTQQIVEKLRRDDFKIGYLDDAGVLYRFGFPLLGDFIEENKKDIIECNMSGDGSLLYKRFDKKALDELAKASEDLLNLCKCQKTFESIASDIKYNLGTGLDMYDVINIKGFNWNEDTRKYLDCFRRAERAIEKIRSAKEIKAVYDSENDSTEEKDD